MSRLSALAPHTSMVDTVNLSPHVDTVNPGPHAVCRGRSCRTASTPRPCRRARGRARWAGGAVLASHRQRCGRESPGAVSLLRGQARATRRRRRRRAGPRSERVGAPDGSRSRAGRQAGRAVSRTHPVRARGAEPARTRGRPRRRERLTCLRTRPRRSRRSRSFDPRSPRACLRIRRSSGSGSAR